MINLMADPERFKWQSPVTKCKKLWTESLERETATCPCENKDKYAKGLKCSHEMLMLLTLTIW